MSRPKKHKPYKPQDLYMHVPGFGVFVQWSANTLDLERAILMRDYLNKFIVWKVSQS